MEDISDLEQTVLAEAASMLLGSSSSTSDNNRGDELPPPTCIMYTNNTKSTDGMEYIQGLSDENAFTFRFVYFNLRGAGELCRLLLTVTGSQWSDVRYPMTVAGTGFAFGTDFQHDTGTGAFDVNMGKLPVLQLIRKDAPDKAIATIGQSHCIARFIARRYGMFGENPIQAARIDTVYECCRDIAMAWYTAKKRKGGKQMWFEKSTSSGSGKSLHALCLLLERCLVSNQVSSIDDEPWCLNTKNVTLADIGIYHLLSTPVAAISGSTASFMDGENDRVRQSYSECPRIQESINAVGALPSIISWEEQRPDTFT